MVLKAAAFIDGQNLFNNIQREFAGNDAIDTSLEAFEPDLVARFIGEHFGLLAAGVTLDVSDIFFVTGVHDTASIRERRTLKEHAGDEKLAEWATLAASWERKLVAMRIRGVHAHRTKLQYRDDVAQEKVTPREQGSLVWLGVEMVLALQKSDHEVALVFS